MAPLHTAIVTLSRVAAAVMVAALVLASPASARSTGRCGLERAETIKRAGTVRVLQTRSDKVYSCFGRTGKRKLLADVADTGRYGTQVRRFVIVGRYVAYVRTEYDMDVTDFIDVVDARRGTLRTGRAGPLEVVLNGSDGGTTQLELTSDGVVAWIYRNPFTYPTRTEVHRRRGTRDDMVAAGQTIDPSLLIVSDGLVIWRQDGQLQSAPARG